MGGDGGVSGCEADLTGDEVPLSELGSAML